MLLRYTVVSVPRAEVFSPIFANFSVHFHFCFARLGAGVVSFAPAQDSRTNYGYALGMLSAVNIDEANASALEGDSYAF